MGQFHDSYEDDPEMDLDLRLLFAVEEYLGSKGVKELNIVSVMPYDKAEVENRQIIYKDEEVSVTADVVNDSGEVRHAVWVKVAFAN